MASDASAALGSAQLAGTFVSPKASGKKMVGRVAGQVAGGVLGGLAADAMTGKNPEAAPSFGRIGYVAITENEVAIVQGKSGLMKPKVGEEVVARVGRSEVASAELERGALQSTLTIAFHDRNPWQFDVAKIYRKGAEQIVGELSGQTA